jgi:hypothetical protein
MSMAREILLSLPPLEEMDDERKDKTLPGCAMFRAGEFVRVDQTERDAAHVASKGKSFPTMSRGISDVLDHVTLTELQRRFIQTDAQLVFKEPPNGKTKH